WNRSERPRFNPMHQFPRRALRWHEIEPPPRAHLLRKLQDALRNRIAAPKIIKKPAVDLGVSQVALHSLEIQSHIYVGFPGPAVGLGSANYASCVSNFRICCSVTP